MAAATEAWEVATVAGEPERVTSIAAMIAQSWVWTRGRLVDTPPHEISACVLACAAALLLCADQLELTGDVAGVGKVTESEY